MVDPLAPLPDPAAVGDMVGAHGQRHALLSRLGALRDKPEPLAALLVDLRDIEHGDDPRFALTLDHYLESWLGARPHELFRLPSQRLLILAPADAAALLDSGARTLMHMLRSHGFGVLRFTAYDVATQVARLAADIVPGEALDRDALLSAADRAQTAALGRLLDVERVLHGADLNSLVREQPIWSFADPAAPVVVTTELVVSLDELESRLDLPLRRDDWLRHEVAVRLDQGLLRHLTRDRAQDPRPFAIDLHTGTVLEARFADLLRRIPAEVRHRLTAELACWEVGLSAPRFAAAAERLGDLGFAVAVDHAPLSALASLDLGGVDPAYVKALWPRHAAPDVVAQLTAAVQRFGADRLVLWRCDEPAALDAGRAAGIQRYQGPAADAAARASGEGASGEESPRRGDRAESDGGADETAAEPTAAEDATEAKPGLFGRLFGRG
ncbi:hypothetical protein D3877_23930 [Azospirillum cavernae]|uniref:EAL domain-containing protein n=1 Tax=Azospirillum cavernae TaxID=2320860 RepID=A0A418VPJ0_9PROT|nr:hypothetical protein [Azospirillum cavernae]RJF78171.1 hypothetical protein D3877_23930 [Azospirillum cavernae]